jgi:oligoendopeptidase F
VPSAHPYVLMNYLGKPRDVMTLAHELGHGVHQVLAAEQGPLMAPTPLTLAETASVFGEMLTFQALLAEATDKREAQGDARLQGRGHDQHRGASDRLLHLRAQGARRRARTAN